MSATPAVVIARIRWGRIPKCRHKLNPKTGRCDGFCRATAEQIKQCKAYRSQKVPA